MSVDSDMSVQSCFYFSLILFNLVLGKTFCLHVNVKDPVLFRRTNLLAAQTSTRHLWGERAEAKKSFSSWVCTMSRANASTYKPKKYAYFADYRTLLNLTELKTKRLNRLLPFFFSLWQAKGLAVGKRKFHGI